MNGQAEFSKLYHCVYALHYHLVMVTKYRRKCITAPMLARFREIAEARCEGWGGKLMEVRASRITFTSWFPCHRTSTSAVS